MAVRAYSMVMGILFIIVGAMGGVSGLLTHPDHGAGYPVIEHAFDGYLLGLFHVNFWHSLAHLMFGILGVFCTNSVGHARGYARFVAVAYAVLAVMGLIPGLNTVWGMMPLHGNDVWLHLLIAGVAGYFGFAWARRNRDPLVVAGV